MQAMKYQTINRIPIHYFGFKNNLIMCEPNAPSYSKKTRPDKTFPSF